MPDMGEEQLTSIAEVGEISSIGGTEAFPEKGAINTF